MLNQALNLPVSMGGYRISQVKILLVWCGLHQINTSLEHRIENLLRRMGEHIYRSKMTEKLVYLYLHINITHARSIGLKNSQGILEICGSLQNMSGRLNRESSWSSPFRMACIYSYFQQFFRHKLSKRVTFASDRFIAGGSLNWY